MDVDSNPENPVIGQRSFSADAAEVARHGLEFCRGLRDGGVLACAKHFPGHGDTTEDSHVALPALEHGMKRLEAVELAPFKAAIEAGLEVCAAVMSAHVVFKALDSSLPPTLSPSVIPPLLRARGFREGCVVSDCLMMSAIAENYTPVEVAELGLRATLDLFLVCHSVAYALALRDALVALALADGMAALTVGLR